MDPRVGEQAIRGLISYIIEHEITIWLKEYIGKQDTIDSGIRDGRKFAVAQG